MCSVQEMGFVDKIFITKPKLDWFYESSAS